MRVNFSRDWLFFWRLQSRLPGHIRITELQTWIMHRWPSSDCNKLLLLLVDSTATMMLEGINFLRKILTRECQRSPLLEWAKLVLKVFSLRGMFAHSGPFQSWPEMCGDVYLLLQTCIYFRQPCSQPLLEMWRLTFKIKADVQNAFVDWSSCFSKKKSFAKKNPPRTSLNVSLNGSKRIFILTKFRGCL